MSQNAGEADAGHLAAPLADRLPGAHRGEVPAAHQPRLPPHLQVPHLHPRHEPRLHRHHHLRLQDVQGFICLRIFVSASYSHATSPQQRQERERDPGDVGEGQVALLRGAARPPPNEAVEEVAILEGKALAEDEVRKASTNRTISPFANLDCHCLIPNYIIKRFSDN